MPAIFPTLYPEEPLLSGLVRYAEAMAYPDESTALYNLFGRTTATPEVRLPAGIGEIVRRLPYGHRYTFMGLTKRHTAYPYHRSFLSEPGARKLRQALLHMHSPLRRRGRRYAAEEVWPDEFVFPSGFLRFCDACVEDDLASPDRPPYWRRVHQLAGVIVCPVHARPLRLSSAAARFPDRHLYENQWPPVGAPVVRSLARALEEPHALIEQPEGQADLVLAVARGSLWLLNNPIPTAHLSELHLRYRARLEERGYIDGTRRIRGMDLHRDFTDRFRGEVLATLDCAPLYPHLRHLRGGWLSSFCGEQHTAHHPLLHLLVQHFLGTTPEEFFTGPVPEPPEPARRAQLEGPCANPVCASYDPPVPRPLAAPSEHETRSFGFVDVDCPACGFAYSQRVAGSRGHVTVRRVGDLWLRRLRELARQPDLSLLDAASALGVGVAKVRSEARTLRVWNGAWGPRPSGQRLSERERARRQRRRVRRRRWRTLVQSYPEWELRALRAKDPETYRYLRRTDSEWLQKELPRAPPTPRTRVPWGHYDLQTSYRIHTIVEALRAWPGAPVRVTVKEVARHLPPWSKLVQRYPRYSFTRKILGPMLESAGAFARRRIVWAAKWLEREGRVPTQDEIAERAGIASRQRPALRTALDDAVQALHARADGYDLPEEWVTPLPDLHDFDGGRPFRKWWSGRVDSPHDFRYFFGSRDDPFPGGYHAEKQRRSKRYRAPP